VLVGAYALGLDAGESLQHATFEIRAPAPLDVLCDTIHPFPSFLHIHAAAINALRNEVGSARGMAIAS
jgi:hypothetical protein